MKILRLTCLLFFALLFYCSTASGQSPLNVLVGKLNERNNQFTAEKIYLQTDKATYLQNDTLWFKAYVLNAAFLTPSKSGLLYAELDDESNKCIKRMLFPVVLGLCRGYMPLNSDDVAEGNYTLRAYTNWIRNFGEEAIFTQPVYITAGGTDTRLFNVSFDYAKQAGKDTVKAAITMRKFNGQPVLLQDAQLRVMDGKLLLARQKDNTKMDGKLDLDFSISDKQTTKNLAISEQDIVKKGTAPGYLIPVQLNRPEYTDLQFMPEGGKLVAGLPVLVGFKAIGETGESVKISGKIIDSKGNPVADFNSTHKGIGSFELVPQAGESYTAVVKLPDGRPKKYPLPAIEPSGISMHIRDMADSLQVTVFATQDADNAGGYYLLGLSRNIVCYAAHITPHSVRSVIHVPASAFPSGIAHFTILNTNNQPLAERIVFIDHHDNLRISLTADKPGYAPHDSVSLKLSITDKTGKPIVGSFSMAVTDDSQVKVDSLAGNILTSLLCTADLKGYVEEPGYYFAGNKANRKTELDNLLLTQGWVGYDWRQAFTPLSSPQFPLEKEYQVTGSVTNIGGKKPLANTDITILSKKPFFVVDTTTDSDGHFAFRGFLPVDTASFMIQARNKKGKSFNVQVNVDEFKPPVFTNAPQLLKPWYVNTDTVLLNNINARTAQKLAVDKFEGMGHMLKEVKVKDKKVIKDSKNLNGPGKADQILDEQDMAKAGHMTLSQLLEKTIKGYHSGYILHSSNLHHMIYDEVTNFVFDGMFIGRFYTPSPQLNAYYNYEQDYLDYYTAEDIKGIEIMFNPGYADSYILQFISPFAVGSPIAFIEITTRSGHGPFMKKTLGTYLYHPLFATLPKQFYKPKYTLKSSINGTDMRSTIHWQPDIITDSLGHATVSFYTADKPANYTIQVNGIDLNGGIGYQRQKITVK